MNRSTLDFWVGIFVVIGIGAVVFLALRVGNLTSLTTTPSYRLEARFDNIGGLKLRAPVKAAGVAVGRVGRISLDPRTCEAVVRVRSDNGFACTKDTHGPIETPGRPGELGQRGLRRNDDHLGDDKGLVEVGRVWND